ncbi:MAG: shikimate kinase [Deltaproteobacteria bacterium]|nr:shikimate kinase [Deltaproteobacteria bacterium]
MSRDNINLIGYRGSGKTSVGLKLAEVLAWTFVDCDLVFRERAGVAIAEFVAQSGWERFRQLESEILEECCQDDQIVLATGGGVVLAAANRALLQKSGLSFWLQASPEITLARLLTDSATALSRPPLSSLALKDEIRLGLQEREPFYREVADFIIAADHQSVDAIVREIVKSFSFNKL